MKDVATNNQSPRIGAHSTKATIFIWPDGSFDIFDENDPNQRVSVWDKYMKLTEPSNQEVNRGQWLAVTNGGHDAITSIDDLLESVAESTSKARERYWEIMELKVKIHDLECPTCKEESA